MSVVRLRRLQADFEKLQDYTRKHPRVKLLAAHGEPPERYQLKYQLKSLRNVAGDIVKISEHMVEIVLLGGYPRLPPQCRMLTPIFHPNIAPHAICIGDHWSAGEPLWSIVARIGEMISYQAYNLKSPLNGEAARWVEGHVEDLPLDPVSLLIDESRAAAIEPPPVAPPIPLARPVAAPIPVVQPIAPIPVAQPVAPPQKITFACGSCQAPLRVAVAQIGKRVRCPKCQMVLVVPGG